MQFRMKLAAVAMAGVASVVLAGAPALASSHASTGKARTGPEVIFGAVHGRAALVNAPVIPLRLRGVVNTRSVVNLGGKGPHKGDTKTLRTGAGKLTIMVTRRPQNTHSLNPKTCRILVRHRHQAGRGGQPEHGRVRGRFRARRGAGVLRRHGAEVQIRAE